MRPVTPALRALALLALILSTWSAGPAWAKGSAPRLVTTVEGITEYDLANGMKVLLFPEPSKPTITVNMTYLVGSRYEGYGETGMAHLLEHMLFKGTPKHPNIPNELTSHGARPNGTTSYDRTNYFETFNATDENLSWALNLEADRMVHSFVARKDLDTEMTVVRNEYERGENSPEAILEERTLSTAFLWHNYGKATIGARSDIENVPIDRLQAFYRRYYQPDNAILMVAGRIDEAKTLVLIDRIFTAIPRPVRKLEPTYTREPTQDGERSVTLRRSGDVQVVSAVYHVPAGSHPDTAPLDILSEILDSAPSGRLYKALVETKKAASVSAWLQALDEPGVLYAQASVRQTDSLDEARKTLLDTLDAVVTQPPTAEEIERARARLLKNIDLTLTNTEHVGLMLSEWIALGDWRLFYLHRDRLRKVTAADVQRVAAAYLKPSNRTVGLFLPTAQPDRAVIPEAPEVAKLVDGYAGDPDIAVGESFSPAPANIESRVIRSRVADGIDLAVLPKKTRGGTVNAALTFRFGDEQSLMNQGLLAPITAQMLQNGTAHHTREQLHDELDRLKARIGINAPTPGQLRVSIETVKENFPAVLALVAEILRAPSFPPAELEHLRQDWLADLEHKKSEPDALAGNALARLLAPYPTGDTRYVQTFEEQIANTTSATIEQVSQFYKGFYGASNVQAAVVGDVEAAEISRQVAALFGDWKSPKPFTRIPNKCFDVAPEVLTIQTPDKENANFSAGMNFPMRDDDPEYPSLVLGNFMLGGGFLSSRLAVRIRQKEGLSYGVYSYFNASPLDQAAAFGGGAIYAPQNADRLVADFDEEITRALKDGFTPKEVADAKSGYLQAREMNRSQDGALARTLVDDLFIGRTLRFDEQLEARIKALKPAEILAAMQHHLSLQKISKIRAGDFLKAAATTVKTAVPPPGK